MITQVITSESNEKIKLFKSLLTSKGIKENQKFILSGRKLVAEFIQQNLKRFKPFALISDRDDDQAFPENSEVIQRYVIPKHVFKELDVIGTAEALLVLEFKPFEFKDFSVGAIDLELICPLGDPKNLGALVRSAVGFGVHEIILSQEAAHPYLPQSVKASAGSVLFANFKKSELKISEIPVIGKNYALDLEGETISSVKWPSQLRLWVGEEGPGLKLSVDQRKKLHFITIPTQRIESLNAMVSTSLALWEWKKSTKI